MGEYIVGCVVLALAVYGCAELLLRLASRVLSPSQKGRGAYVLSFAENGNEAECILRSLAMQHSYPIIVIDEGLDNETRGVVLRLARHYSHLHLCARENFEEIWNNCLQ